MLSNFCLPLRLRPTLSAALCFLTLSQVGHASAKHRESYYEGQLEIFEKFRESGTNDGPLGFFGTKLVAINVKKKGWIGTIEISDPNTGEPLFERIQISQSFSPTFKHLWKMEMKIEGLNTTLKLSKTKGCFKGNSEPADYLATVCLKKDGNIRFDIDRTNGKPVFKLSAGSFTRPLLPQTRPINLDQAIKIAHDTNPTSKLEFIQKRQSKELLNLAWLRLLPRLSAPATANLWLPAPVTPQPYAQTIGTIAPFLSINNWFAIDDARRNSRIIDTGFVIFQANLANVVEQSVYIYRKDLLLNSDYTELLANLQKTMNQAKKIESLGKTTQYISSDNLHDMIQDLQTIINIVKDAQASNNLANDKHTLAQALGIHDLEIVRDIKIGPESVPIEKAVKLSLNLIANEASKISLEYMERFQAKLATIQARHSQIEHPFKLFDFNGDPSDGFGFNLISEFKLDRLTIRAAEENEKIVSDQVRKTVSDAVENYNDAIDGYKNATEARDRLKGRLDSLLKPIAEFSFDQLQPILLPMSLDAGETIETVAKDYFNFMNLARNYHAAFRISRATLDRAKLVNYYDQFKPEEDRNQSSHSSTEIISQDDLVKDDNKIDMEQDEGKSYHLAIDSDLVFSGLIGQK